VISQSERQTIKLDLFDYCVFDEFEGTLLNLQGVKEIMDSAQDEADMCWQFDDVYINAEDDSIYHLCFSRAKP